MFFNINDDNLKDFLLRKYGLQLSDAEIEEIIQWFKENESRINEDNVDGLLLEHVQKTYPDKRIRFYEDDSSNLNYLLMLLKKNAGK